MFTTIHNYLYNLSVYYYVPLAVVLTTALHVLGIVILFPIRSPETTKMPVVSLSSGDLFLDILFLPFLETLIFQAFVIYLLKKIKKLNAIAICIISVFPFILAHSSSKYVVALFAGLALSYSYLLYSKKRNAGYAILVVFLIHALLNAKSRALFYFLEY